MLKIVQDGVYEAKFVVETLENLALPLILENGMLQSFSRIVFKIFCLLYLFEGQLLNDDLCDCQTLHHTFLLKNALQTLGQIDCSTAHQ